MYKDFQDFWNNKWSNIDFIGNTKFAPKVLKYINNKNIKLLDLWCWAWRDSIYFAEKWFEVEAFDFSKNALDSLKQFALDKDLNINTILWSILDYDFNKNYYDVIYSCNSLHYFDEENIKIIIKKLKESLKVWWYIFLRVKSINDFAYWKWEKLGNNFYKNWDDIKYYFDVNLIKELFTDFEILEIDELNDTHDKISWEKSINWFVDLVAIKNNFRLKVIF